MEHPRATVILTRPQGKNQALQLCLQQAGLDVIILPALILQPEPVADPVPDPAAFDLIFFVSGFAVDCFFDLLRERDMSWPKYRYAGCVGPGTRQALERRGVAPEQILSPAGHLPYDSSGFLASLQTSGMLTVFKSVLLVCGTTGNPWLAQQLRDLSVTVTRFALYARHATQWDERQRQQMRSLLADPSQKKYVVLTSPQGIDAFVGNLATAKIHPDSIAASTTFIVTHVGQLAHLKHIWQHKLSLSNADALRVQQALPRDDAIFHAVTISD
ncbi:uroporphyrinogen-III synthase [Advenella sp. S44]|uniref:uroporphyrinogen-III synthase n=1 Tax=Advenella sp. S44 TaxID=1982755 RepID=UPI001374800C|nr:uroporphyrinogen-III synthase [Advenella sp. S44]